MGKKMLCPNCQILKNKIDTNISNQVGNIKKFIKPQLFKAASKAAKVATKGITTATTLRHKVSMITNVQLVSQRSLRGWIRFLLGKTLSKHAKIKNSAKKNSKTDH